LPAVPVGRARRVRCVLEMRARAPRRAGLIIPQPSQQDRGTAGNAARRLAKGVFAKKSVPSMKSVVKSTSP
jgi:hypothetical protein